MNVVIPCPCPPKSDGQPRHAHDTVTFRDRLDFRGGMVIRKAITMLKVEDPESGAAEVLAAMSEHYMLEGIERLDDHRRQGQAGRMRQGRHPPLHGRAPGHRVRQPRGRGRQPVRRTGSAPFSEEGGRILAAFADGTIDISADWLGGEAPEALAAVLDFHYADGRHHVDYTVARWRLQYIAEISVGARLRAAVHEEDAKVRKLKSVV